MASFDVEDWESKDYDELEKRVGKTFPKSCKILSTTYLIRTNENKDTITDWFKNQMKNKDKIRICVVKYVESQYWLSKPIRDCISNMQS